MTSSMTGFARRETSGPYGQLTCELRSVNHRYLEPGFRLPEELRALEGELRNLLGRELKRGKVDCTIHLRATQQSERELQVDEVALDRLLKRSQDIAARLPGGGPAAALNPLEVLRWPGVLREVTPDTESLVVAARELFLATVHDLAAHRAREGARLRELIEQRSAALQQIVVALRVRMPEVRAKMRSRLQEKLAELGNSVNAERFEQELLLLLQRADVDEELDRLDGHLREISHVLAETGAGRRLDFLMQELNREANTLASKSQELDTTRYAVDLKVLIEQMREQIQNIE
jgi:uncharacterized protein (TIGR00255 family)